MAEVLLKPGVRVRTPDGLSGLWQRLDKEKRHVVLCNGDQKERAYDKVWLASCEGEPFPRGVVTDTGGMD